jgi:hypothetical protein
MMQEGSDANIFRKEEEETMLNWLLEVLIGEDV